MHPQRTSLEHEDECDEHTPLLNNRPPPPPPPAAELENQQRRFDRMQRQTYILCFLLIFLAEVGASMQDAPLNKVLEGIMCRNCHPELRGNATATGLEMVGKDERCKEQAVQGELRQIRPPADLESLYIRTRARSCVLCCCL